MRIMTSNIWGDYFNNPTHGRDEQLFAVYQKYMPDVLGFQEITSGWYQSTLFQKLSQNYRLVGTELLESENYVPLAIKKDFSIIAKGFEYLVRTPDLSKAITWAVIRKNDLMVAVCNTHFWWMRGTESEEVKQQKGVLDYSFEDHCRLRENNAEQLSQMMRWLNEKYSCPVFAFGDMNATVMEGVFEIYRKNNVKNLFDMAEQKDLTCTIHGDPVKDRNHHFYGKKAEKEYIEKFRQILCLPKIESAEGYQTSIDHIVALGDSFKVRQYRVVEDQEALDASDHSPVYADIEFLCCATNLKNE